MTDAILSQIAGSGIALAGVIITLIYTQRNFITNLRNENTKEKELREFQIKRDVFMEAAEALAQAAHYYTRIPDMKHEEMQREQPILARLSGVTQKMHLVSNFTTIEKLAEFNFIGTEQISIAMLSKMPAMMLDGDIAANESTIEFWKEENHKLETEIVALLSADQRSPYVNDIRKRITSNSDRIIAAHEKNSELHQRKIMAINECRQATLTGLPIINAAMTKVMVELRNEIGFCIDAARYSQLMDESNAAAKKIAERTMEKVTATVMAEWENPSKETPPRTDRDEV